MEVLLPAREAARQLNVSKKTLLKWCAEKRINYIRHPSGATKFRQSAIDLFNAQHEVKATNNAPLVRWKPKRRAA
jgi:excisionase family DNA binding protein